MGSGKGGQQTSTVTLPPEITEQAQQNMQLASQVGSLPYAPYFGGSVAAFSPGQMSGFNNMNEAANAFGLQGSAGRGLPSAQNFGGVQAYSTERPYNAAMSQVDPAVAELYRSFFYPHNTAAVTTATPIAAARAGVTNPPTPTQARSPTSTSQSATQAAQARALARAPGDKKFIPTQRSWYVDNDGDVRFRNY